MKVEEVLHSSRKHLPLSWAMHRILTTVVMRETMSGRSVTDTGLFKSSCRKYMNNQATKKQNRRSQFIHVNQDCKKVIKSYPPNAAVNICDFFGKYKTV
jgi:hypothetical protein